MKKLIAVATVAAMMTSGSAFAADTASANITLSANVPNTCYIVGLTPGTLPTNVSGTSANNTTSGAVTVSYNNELANPSTAVAVAKAVTYNLSAYCNYASHTVGLQSVNGGLVTASNQNTVGNFDHRINYTASYVWDGTVSPSITTSGNLGNGTSFAKTDNKTAALPTNVTNATLTITTAVGTDPLVQGTYGDTLKISLGAAL